MYFSKQHSALFWHCEVSERICPARTVPETTVALTVVEKRCRRLRMCTFSLISRIFSVTACYFLSLNK